MLVQDIFNHGPILFLDFLKQLGELCTIDILGDFPCLCWRYFTLHNNRSSRGWRFLRKGLCLHFRRQLFDDFNLLHNGFLFEDTVLVLTVGPLNHRGSGTTRQLKFKDVNASTEQSPRTLNHQSSLRKSNKGNMTTRQGNTNTRLNHKRCISHNQKSHVTRFATNNLLNGRCCLEKLFGSQTFNAIKRFTSQEDLGAS